ncbi:MAG: TolB family protein, partial [Actinomycetota bacterium]
VPGDTNGRDDVFVHDRATGRTFLVSASTPGAIGNGASSQPAISADGRYVAFVSEATNFAPENNPVNAQGVSVNARDIFVRDLAKGSTIRITRGGGNLGTVGSSFDPSISADGSYVAFTSLDRALVYPDCNKVHDIFLWERSSNSIRRITRGTTKATCGQPGATWEGDFQADRQSENPVISADGSVIAFASDASNLDASHPDRPWYAIDEQPPKSGGPRLGTNIFVWTRNGDTITRIDNAPGGAEPNGDSGFVPAISADGRFVAYTSVASDLVPGDTNGVRDTLLYDRLTATTTRVSVGTGGAEQSCPGREDQTPCQSYESAALSADGRLVAFVSGATNLVQPDSNVTGRDVYVRDTGTSTTTRVNVSGSGAQANAGTTGSAPAMSWDGRFTAYVSGATNLVGGDTNGVADVYVSDRAPGDALPSSWGAPSWPDLAGTGGGGDDGGTGGGTGPSGSGYWMVSSRGDVYAFGDALDAGGAATASAAVDVEPTPGGGGYWILDDAGRVYTRGNAPALGGAAMGPGEKAVSLSGTPDGEGYWIFTDKGRVVPVGSAEFRGDMSQTTLNGPVLDSVVTPSGNGYWMVASDGGIFSFGDAQFHGSMGGRHLNRPVMSMAPDPDGQGYWLVASDGGIFAFDAPFYGSMGATPLNKPVSGMVPGSGGYLMVAEDGGIFAFGNVPFHGSLGANPPAFPVVAVALK